MEFYNNRRLQVWTVSQEIQSRGFFFVHGKEFTGDNVVHSNLVVPEFNGTDTEYLKIMNGELLPGQRIRALRFANLSAAFKLSSEVIQPIVRERITNPSTGIQTYSELDDPYELQILSPDLNHGIEVSGVHNGVIFDLAFSYHPPNSSPPHISRSYLTSGDPK